MYDRHSSSHVAVTRTAKFDHLDIIQNTSTYRYWGTALAPAHYTLQRMNEAFPGRAQPGLWKIISNRFFGDIAMLR